MTEEKEIKQLPKGWKWVKLGEVFTIERGGSPRPIDDYLSKDVNAINWIKIGDTKGITKYIYKTTEKIKPEGVKKSRMVYEGDFILSNSMSFGKPFIMKTSGCIHDGWLVIRKNENIENNFLYYVLSSPSVYQQFINLAKGSTVKNLNIEAVKQVSIALPPFKTQLAIVSKIEELFSEIENGIKSLFAAKEQLKKYRQSVLKWAFEGKLTNGLNCDLFDLRDEHDLSIAAEPETEYRVERNHNNQANQKNHSSDKGELPEGWKWMKSGELFDFVTSGSRGWAKYYSDKGAIFIRITNLDFDTLDLDLEENKIQYVNPPSNSEGIRTKVQEGDFLFSITGYLGMFAIAPKLNNAFVNQHISLCRPKNNFDKKYVGYWIISKSGGHHYLNKMTKGATKAGLGLDDIKNFPVPMAPLEEQHKIVQAIESRLSVADKMEESITESLQQAEALKQSILKKAFEGKLV